jgi:hypothetical protein
MSWGDIEKKFQTNAKNAKIKMEFDSEIYVEIGEEINRKTYSKII